MADADSRPMKKGWVNRNDTDDETQDAAEAAAERTKKSVLAPRKPGATTMALEAVGFAPLVAKTVVGHVAGEVVKEYKRRKSPLYDKAEKSDEEE